MSFNLPLILLILTVITGIAWFYDFFALRSARKKRIAAVEAQYDNLDGSQKKRSEQYQQAILNAEKEEGWIEFPKSIFPVIFIVFFLRSFVFEPFQIPSGSMIPTLVEGDFIVVSKYAYGIRLPVFRNKVIETGEPKRGDVMVFFPPNNDQYFIKRVIGLPGDVIQYDRNGDLTINGDPVSRTLDYVRDQRCTIADHKLTVYKEAISAEKTYTVQGCDIKYERPSVDQYEVPEGHFFMMGDNRYNSSDSRVWGPVPEERIVGKAVFKWLYWKEFFSVPSFARAGEIQ